MSDYFEFLSESGLTSVMTQVFPLGEEITSPPALMNIQNAKVLLKKHQKKKSHRRVTISPQIFSGKKRKNDDVIGLKFLIIDLDSTPKTRAHEKDCKPEDRATCTTCRVKIGLKPKLLKQVQKVCKLIMARGFVNVNDIVDSGNGYQIYIPVDVTFTAGKGGNSERKTYKPRLADLTKNLDSYLETLGGELGCDGASETLSQTWKIPGSWNIKDRDRKYNQSRIVSGFDSSTLKEKQEKNTVAYLNLSTVLTKAKKRSTSKQPKSQSTSTEPLESPKGIKSNSANFKDNNLAQIEELLGGRFGDYGSFDSSSRAYQSYMNIRRGGYRFKSEPEQQLWAVVNNLVKYHNLTKVALLSKIEQLYKLDSNLGSFNKHKLGIDRVIRNAQDKYGRSAGDELFVDGEDIPLVKSSKIHSTECVYEHFEEYVNDSGRVVQVSTNEFLYYFQWSPYGGHNCVLYSTTKLAPGFNKISLRRIDPEVQDKLFDKLPFFNLNELARHLGYPSERHILKFAENVWKEHGLLIKLEGHISSRKQYFSSVFSDKVEVKPRQFMEGHPRFYQHITQYEQSDVLKILAEKNIVDFLMEHYHCEGRSHKLDYTLMPGIIRIDNCKVDDFNDVQKYQANFLCITEAGTGKSTTAETMCATSLIGRATESHNKGFSDGQGNVHVGALHQRVAPFIHDEIQNVKDDNMAKYESAMAGTSSDQLTGSQRLANEPLCLFGFMGNPIADNLDDGIADKDSLFHKQVTEVICRFGNKEAMGRRFATIILDDNLGKPLRTDGQHIKKICGFIESVSHYLSPWFTDLLLNEDKVARWLNTPHSKEYLTALNQALPDLESASPDLYLFWKGQKSSHSYARGQALKLAVLTCGDKYLAGETVPVKTILEQGDLWYEKIIDMNTDSLQKCVTDRQEFEQSRVESLVHRDYATLHLKMIIHTASVHFYRYGGYGGYGKYGVFKLAPPFFTKENMLKTYKCLFKNYRSTDSKSAGRIGETFHSISHGLCVKSERKLVEYNRELNNYGISLERLSVDDKGVNYNIRLTNAPRLYKVGECIDKTLDKSLEEESNESE